MKKPILITLTVLFALSLKSQIVEDWTSPVALTDSSSFNSNPIVIISPDNYDDLFMFYEKRQSQSGPGQIWWKKISDPASEEQMLIGGWPEVDYRNPQVIHQDYLIYESNIFGNYDLFGVKFDENGLAGDIFQLTNTDYDENSFFSPYIGAHSGCWESEENIIFADLEVSQDTLFLTEIETIDTGNCFNPVTTGEYIAWLKIENNESHIYYSVSTYPSWQWSDPDTIIQTGDNTNLTISKGAPGYYGGGRILCWQASDKIYFTSTWWPYVDIPYSPDVPDIVYYSEPTAFDLFIGSKMAPNLYSFVGIIDSIRDIYIIDNLFGGENLNITNDSIVNKNPKLFAGREYWPYEIINIWQTEIGGYDVLYESTAWYIGPGSISEDELQQLNIGPNPMFKNQNVIISSPESIFINLVQVYSGGGSLIIEKLFNIQSKQFEIDFNGILPGLYFIKIQTSQGESIHKLIKM